MKNERKIKRIISVILTFGLLGTLTACGNAGANENSAGNDVSNSQIETNENTETLQEKENANVESGADDDKLVVTIAHVSATYPEYISKVAYSQGFFEEEFEDDGIEINYVDIGIGAQISEGYLAGNVDMAFYGDFPILSGYANGTDAKIISNVSFSQAGMGLLVKSDSDIQDISQIKGKRVGFGIGTTQQLEINQYLATGGYTEDDIEVYNLPTSTEALTALESGDVDAIRADGINYAEWIADGTARPIVTGEEANAGFSLYVTASNSFLKEHGDIAVRVLKVLNRTNEWFNESEENRQKGLQAISEFTEMSIEDLQLVLDNYDVTVHLNEDDIERLHTTYNFMVENGFLEKEFNLDDVYDTSYAEAALAE